MANQTSPVKSEQEAKECMEVFAEKYQILAELPGGAQAQVFRARHIQLDRIVILKKLKSLDVDGAAWLRFKREAQLSAQLNHPHIAAVYDFGTWEGGCFIAAEFVDGQDLRSLLQQKILLSQAQKKQIILDIVSALDFAHQKGILHRDIKPANLMITPEFRVKIIDFGLARLVDEASVTQVGDITGTPMYLAPEIIQGSPASAASDWFACGASLWELITGERLFAGGSINEIFYQILHTRPNFHQPAFSDWAQAFVRQLEHMLAARPQDRIVQVDQIATALGLSAIPGKIASSPEKKPMRKYLAWAGMGALGLTLCLAIGIYFSNGGTESAETTAQMASRQAEINPVEMTNKSVPEDSVEPVQSQAPGAGKENRVVATAPETLAAPILSPEIPGQRAQTISTPIPSDAGRGFLTIICHPWAEVFLDEIKIGATPIAEKIDLGAGSHRITFKNPDFPIIRKNLEISRNQTLELKINLYREVGYLEVKVFPFAQVFIDDRFIGFSPLAEMVKLAPGEHRLRLVHEQYPEALRLFQISAAETLSIAANLTHANPWHEN